MVRYHTQFFIESKIDNLLVIGLLQKDQPSVSGYGPTQRHAAIGQSFG